jgi:hypothetical protein
MYDPKRLRILIERVGPPAHSLADIPLQYWQPKSNPFPHADRDCKSLRTKAPVATRYTLRDMTSEGWCCHDCGIDPPDPDLCRLLQLFEELESLCDDVAGVRTTTDLDNPTRVYRAYRHLVEATAVAQYSCRTVLEQYAQNVADGCARDLTAYRQEWGRNTLRNADRDLRRVAVSADGVLYGDGEDAFTALDWLILERGTPRRTNASEAELVLPMSMVMSGRYSHVVDLGVAEPSQQRTGSQSSSRKPAQRNQPRRSRASSGRSGGPRSPSSP